MARRGLRCRKLWYCSVRVSFVVLCLRCFPEQAVRNTYRWTSSPNGTNPPSVHTSSLLSTLQNQPWAVRGLRRPLPSTLPILAEPGYHTLPTILVNVHMRAMTCLSMQSSLLVQRSQTDVVIAIERQIHPRHWLIWTVVISGKSEPWRCGRDDIGFQAVCMLSEGTSQSREVGLLEIEQNKVVQACDCLFVRLVPGGDIAFVAIECLETAHYRLSVVRPLVVEIP